ncbi:MAG: histone deacetylase [Pseudomonadota bacterium]
MAFGTGIVRHDLYKEHLSHSSHIESPNRLDVIYDMLDENNMLNSIMVVHPRPALQDELALVHDISHIERIAHTHGHPHVMLDPDTQTTPLSYQAAILAAGGVFSLIDQIIDGRIKNGFALVRPPGHHAERDRAKGFCLFNNVALGARYAMKRHSINKILIVDWDLHHGNGTQNTFYSDSNVLYFSTHLYPCYPGSGGIAEVGKAEGKGFTVNVPLDPGQGDSEFFKIFECVLSPIVRDFKPELILVSAGFDIYINDPLGSMRVTPQGFAALTRILMRLAEETAKGRLAMVLEGGYDLAGLRDSVKAVLKELAHESILSEKYLKKLSEGHEPSIIDRVIRVHKMRRACTNLFCQYGDSM